MSFASYATNLAPGATGGWDVYVRDRELGTTELVSVASDGTGGNSGSLSSAISADGRYVAFESYATNLAPGDTNQDLDVFVRDRQTGRTERVSVAPDGAGGNGASDWPSISADGRYVAFQSFASNLVPADANATLDIFVRDRATGVTERVSVSSEGAEAAGGSQLPAISPDGRYLAFASYADNLVPGDAGGPLEPFGDLDVFVHDRQTGLTERVSPALGGAQGNGFSDWPSVTPGGRYVGFMSAASNLVPGDANGAYDVFLRDRGPAVGVGEVAASVSDGRVNASGWATFSGAVLASASDAPDDGGVGAREAGGELTGASLTYRPEPEDLLVRLRLAGLPGLRPSGLPCVALTGTCPPGAAGAPGVVSGLALRVVGARYEVRVLRAGATAVPPAAPYFALYRCEAVCTELARLSGGYGTTGEEVRVSVPLSSLGAGEGDAVMGLRAFTAVGGAGSGGLAVLDEVSLGDAGIPARSATLGIAPAGTPEREVAFDTPAGLSEGAFSGTLDASSLPVGEYEVWARACLGTACGATSTRIVIG